jgi:hypothetical protein
MAGFLGGSSGSGGGGEIQFPTEFIDPVTKLRVSEPETLIDTDFEYGLQPTKWETVELINNTPSFFSKSGDTTINGILSMVTTATSREIKVTTAENHGLAVGIPINVSGTKSITADGSYIINSIPDPKSFTYLAKQNQDTTASIFDLYTSIITGEFFQGSQIKISDSQGIVTNAAAPSVLTVQTDSPHGFQVGTPFYFLNLNSTVSQQFDASNTGAKTFDSSNSATAQSFDGSNTFTTYLIDLNNKATIGGTVSATVTFNATNDTITVTHTTENFVGLKIGAPLYYNVTAAAGYFNTYPRGVVYLATTGNNVLGTNSSTFSVSSIPGGTAIDLTVYPSGTFQKANAATTFPGNNNETQNPFQIQVYQNAGQSFDGANATGSLSTVNTYSGTIIQLNNDAGTTVSPFIALRSMVFYTTTGTAATGLTNNTTYWVTYYNEPAGASVPGFFQIKVSALPGGADISISGGTGTQKFRKIGISTDKDVIHLPSHNLALGDLVRYTYPEAGAFTQAAAASDYYYVDKIYDVDNIQLGLTKGSGGLTQIAANTWEWTTGPVTDVSEIFTQNPGALTQLPNSGVFYLKYPINIVGGTQTITVACRKDTTNNRVAQSAFTMRGQGWSFQSGISTLWFYSSDDHDSLAMVADGTGIIARTNTNSWNSSNWDIFRGANQGSGNVGLNSVLPGSPSDVSGNASLVAFNKTNINVYVDLGNSRLRCHNRSYVSYNSDLSTYIGTASPTNSLMILSDGVNGFVIYRWGNARAVEIRMNLATGAIFSTRNFAFSAGQSNGTEEDTFGTLLHAVDGGFTYYANTTWHEDRFPWTARGSLTNTNTYSTGGASTQTDMDLFGSIDSGDRQVWFADWGHDDGGLFQQGNDDRLSVRKTNIYFLPDNYTA